MSIRRMIANWWRDIFAEPLSLGTPNDPYSSLGVAQVDECRHSHDHSGELPLHAAPRMLFPAPAWVVGKDGPNVPAEPDHYTKLRAELCELDWDVLLDACEMPVPRPVLRGAAFNESAKYLQRCGYFTSGWTPTDEGRKAADSELIRRRRGS